MALNGSPKAEVTGSNPVGCATFPPPLCAAASIGRAMLLRVWPSCRLRKSYDGVMSHHGAGVIGARRDSTAHPHNMRATGPLFAGRGEGE